MLALVICCMLLASNVAIVQASSASAAAHHPDAPSWLVNWPDHFRREAVQDSSALVDVRDDSDEMMAQGLLVKREMVTLRGSVDGENVDALEHFFWGKKAGVAIELGALDGSASMLSMTHVFESELNWKRIIIEGNPGLKDAMKAHSPRSFAVNAAICEHEAVVHYVSKSLVSGILEFMDDKFMTAFHKELRDIEAVPGDSTSIDWGAPAGQAFVDSKMVIPISCIPLHTILKFAKIRHVNLFILDVEGGELGILKSTDWDFVKFDVLCIETEEGFRPPGYVEEVKAFMASKGYNHYMDVARNSWFTHKDFVPSAREGIDKNTWTGGYQRIIRKNVLFRVAVAVTWPILYAAVAVLLLVLYMFRKFLLWKYMPKAIPK